MTGDKAPLIELSHVSKAFGDNVVLDDVSLAIREGEITSIIGKSGVGKSVLLKHIIGLLAPDRGEVLFSGKRFPDMSRAERRRLLDGFSYVFQNTALFDSMTVYEDVALPLTEKTRKPGAEVREAVAAILSQLEIDDVADRYPSQLSGGMQKRVALARALVTKPATVLFDEPTTGLDPIRKSAVHGMISDYQKRFGFTGVIVSHDIPDIFFISQHVAMLDRGRILFDGTSEEIQRSQDPEVLEFLRGLEGTVDALTGTQTHAQLIRRYDEETHRARNAQRGFSVLVFTLENLADIQDHAGHAAAQTIMRNFASLLAAHLRPGDTCARLGMDHILAILPETDPDKARRVCEGLKNELSRRPMADLKPYPGFCISISAGAAQATEQIPMEAALEKAREAAGTLCEFKVC